MTTYSPEQRQWAIETYRKTRKNYTSRMECCTRIANDLGAHVNTVTRWINREFGSPAPSAEDTTRWAALVGENASLRQENLRLKQVQ
ncbi:transposase [Nocardia asteroides]|uniref:transposase n=1 Tax=Nocardia asteroides TaxID=1824 RepID=UPI0037C9344E